jgi:Mn2+/Fe2+ NRAMP family transporter
MVASAAVVGPGVLTGLSDDDPAGITTYSILGADFGYRLLWVLLTRDRSLMGKYATGRAWTVVIVAVTLMIAAATIVLGLVLVGG